MTNWDWIIAIIGAFAWGFTFGGNLAERYWADHCNNGSVHFRGKFYKVIAEHEE